MRNRLLSRAKSFLLPARKRTYRACFGLYAGLLFDASLRENLQLLLGLWERETYSYIDIARKRCEWVVDVGAGDGELVLFLIKQSPAKTIIAVEPRPDGRKNILRNLALNSVDSSRVLIENQLVGLDTNEGFVSLDRLTEPLAGRGFIKIDVDGAELGVLQSGARCLGKGQLDVMVETHSMSLEWECIRLLESYGFLCRVIKNAWWRAILPELRPIEHNRWLWATRE
jgi:hypothetical protein